MGGNDPPREAGGGPASPPPPPLPSNSEPCAFGCSCLNVTIAARVGNEDLTRLGKGPSAFKPGEHIRAYLPVRAETVRHAEMTTFEPDTSDASDSKSQPDVPSPKTVWRKCLVCSVRVYCAKDTKSADAPPQDTWVQLNPADGVLFGESLDTAKALPPLPFSGLSMELPATSTFGRPPAVTTPVPYPDGAAAATSTGALLRPVPDPFFLPPPFIPSHPVLRDMCKGAIEALHNKHDELERDIRAYISARAADMSRVEEQVRAEVEALWDRYARETGADMVDRRSSISRQSRPDQQQSQQNQQSQSQNQLDSPTPKPPIIPTVDIDTPSGVPESLGGAAPVAAASRPVAAGGIASLLSASLSANAFHAPPPKQIPRIGDNDFEMLAKSRSNDMGESREVAMSFAFSAMESHAAAAATQRKGQRSRSRDRHREARMEEEMEEIKEETDKGIDSWINIERAQAKRKVTRELSKEHKEEQAETSQDKSVANGHGKERKGKVTFQEPFKNEEGEDEADGADGHDDDGEWLCERGAATGMESADAASGIVFDFETDTPAQERPKPSHSDPKTSRSRTIVEDNLSRTFAADAPSHRAAWRKFEQNESMIKALHRRDRSSDDEDEDNEGSTFSSAANLARSVPVAIVKPQRHVATESHPMQRKTSLTDREGVWVPELISAMRERPKPHGLSPASASPIPAAGRRVSIAVPIAGSFLPGGRRGSRSGDRGRELEQVKSYAADPGAVFEALAEGAVDSDHDEDDKDEDDDSDDGVADGAGDDTSARFVPPHLLAARDADKMASRP